MAATANPSTATAHGRRQQAATIETRHRGMRATSAGCGSVIGLFASVRKAGTLARPHRRDKRNLEEGDKVRSLPPLVTLSPCHLVTLSPVTLSPCPLVTLSPCHL